MIMKLPILVRLKNQKTSLVYRTKPRAKFDEQGHVVWHTGMPVN